MHLPSLNEEGAGYTNFLAIHAQCKLTASNPQAPTPQAQ